MPKISIVMPVKNGQEYIERTMESALKQSMPEVELICVDDGSEDNSPKILQEMAEKDERVKVITYDRTRGAAKARKDGILQAEGKYIMFLDADDYLDPGACEYLYQAMEEKHVDILHFSSVVENCGAGRARTERMTGFVEPYVGRLENEEVFFACFQEKKYRFNLWNKIFKASVCKEAMQFLEDDYLPKANDLYAYFLIAYFAKSYEGMETPGFYHYCFGKGSTGSNTLSLTQFEIYCREKDVADKLYTFVQNQKCGARYLDCVKEIDTHFLNECLNNWKEYLRPELSSAGFDLLASKWEPSQLANGLALKYHKDRAIISKKIYGAESLKKREGEIKTIGIFYFRMACGGVQRVISLQIPMFLKLGYRVVLFTEEENKEYEFDIPKEVERVTLPTSFDIEMSQYQPHGAMLEEKLKEYKVDFLLYHAGSSDALLYDLLITKLLGISFGVLLHEMFSQRMVSMDRSVSQKPDMFRLMDKLLVLSETEKRYWKTLGVNAEYIPNPVQLIPAEPKEKKYILWIGRFAAQQKRFEDAVHIMNYVVEQLPDAKMKMIGSNYTANAKQKIQKLIEKYHLEDNVEVLDFQKDVSELYEHAQVHLMTSAYEAFPMTIIESKFYGVPLVTYELPWVELLKDGKGHINVPQEDRRAAANAIVTLLKDSEKLDRMSKEAQESILPWMDVDHIQLWKKILGELSDTTGNQNVGETLDETEEEYAVILKTMLFHYTKAVQKYEKLQVQNVKLQEKADKLSAENKKLKGRLEYRVRKKLGSIKRKILGK